MLRHLPVPYSVDDGVGGLHLYVGDGQPDNCPVRQLLYYRGEPL